jgi:23S rRNA-/tRNA-specific pseudouridylate synthase
MRFTDEMSDQGPQLEILYDHGPCLVVNKPPGLLTQAPAGIDSLEVRVKEFYRQREGKEPGSNLYLGLPHRLDRPVSGAIVFARQARAAQRLAAQFEHRTVTKVYWAVVEGDVEPDEGTWTDHLHKRHGMAQSIVVTPDDPRGKLAVMHWRVLGRWMHDAGCLLADTIPDAGRATSNSRDPTDRRPIVSWLEVQLETGRTHQIRVQSASRGYPVLGDAQYGSGQPFGEQFNDERLRAIALHARQLAFRHPMIDETVDVIAPTPPTWDSIKLPVRGRDYVVD